MDVGVCGHGMKANPIGYLWSKYECSLISDCQDMDIKIFNTEILLFEGVLDIDL